MTSDKPYGYYVNPILQAVKANDDQRKKITQVVEELQIDDRADTRKKFKEKSNRHFCRGMAKGASAEDLLVAQRELDKFGVR